MRGVLSGGGQVPDWVKKDDNTVDELRDSVKDAVDILNNTEAVEMASPFWVYRD